MRRKRAETTARPPPQLVLRDFELCDSVSGVSAPVFGEELHACFDHLAKCNGFSVDKILANQSIPRGMSLPCCVARRIPKGVGSLDDQSGYILVKLRRGRTVVGHSFLGTEASSSADPEYRADARISHGSDVSSPPRARRRHAGPPDWLQDHSTSPGTPGSEAEGRTQPVLVRLHRAAALAASARPEADSKRWVRHICGNKRCLVVSHFRFGTQEQNERDEEYHETHPGCSREQHGSLQ